MRQRAAMMKCLSGLPVLLGLSIALGASGADTTPDSTAPQVAFVNPANLATDVPVNRQIAVAFSEAMKRQTITKKGTFTLAQGTTPVKGKVAYAGTTATFKAKGNLAAGTSYTATITTGATDLAGNALASNYVWSFTTGTSSDTTPPTVTFVNPADLATDVPINGAIAATFSEWMDPRSITKAVFTIAQGKKRVKGTVACAGTTATFTPASALTLNTVYTATITTKAKDLAGNALASNYVWSFTTGTSSDTTLPTVTLVSPVDLATDVPINGAIAATFSEWMDPLTITTVTFTVTGPSEMPVAGTVACAGSTATFTPASNLAASTSYAATITTGATDLAGNALASNYVWSFTTGTSLDTTPPTVASTNPANLATDVPVNWKIAAIFSEGMAPLTITAATFTIAQGTTPVTGTVACTGTTVTFTPAGNLAPSTVHTATITTGATDLAGNAVAANFIWSFTTGTTAAKGPAPVSLGMAGNFAILAKSGIDTVPTSAVTGDIGVSPAAASYITGFGLTADSSNVFSTSPQVTGKVYAADYAVPTPSNLTTAVSNMETAYTDAAGRPTPDFTELGAGDISGLTLVPGLYKWGTGLSINTDVTLSGGPNDVWIFQVGQGITLANGAKVVLTGGALPQNIFWQSFGVVSIGTTAHFEGVVLSQTAITLDTGASINGRLLSQTAVTVKSSTVTQPAP